jgi:hypothetical protein
MVIIAPPASGEQRHVALALEAVSDRGKVHLKSTWLDHSRWADVTAQRTVLQFRLVA